MPHYRVPFFEGLRAALAQKGIELDFVYGKPTGADAAKKDTATLPWARQVDLKVIHMGSSELVWHPVLGELGRYDLVITEQANRTLINYLLLFRQMMGRRFAFWGHGRNLQDDPASLKNRFKALYTNRCHWWFAYAEGVKQRLIQDGFPAERITAVQNSIDTNGLARDVAAVSPDRVQALRRELGFEDSARVGIYCGGMYEEKQIPLLLEAARKIKAAVPQFHLLAVGSGPEAHLFQEASSHLGWVHAVGPKFGVEKATHFALAELFLMPGLVGLGVLDSFVTGVPMITTRYPFHSPEIDYLHDGINGLITGISADEYARGVIDLLNDQPRLNTLRAGAKASAGRYTMEAMVANFAEGIERALL